ncbi:hypothetical protein H6P81_018695 [Aristolochia fimbriata]|uniref:Uncharacterized protein n=1 Tax=Aristolochia fimbriata TaxID=158543 RepID=A0AAV7E4S1_ARIFI|nr:hypothetical protein H6P81_018695 [Aristolochia fimbriata]
MKISGFSISILLALFFVLFFSAADAKLCYEQWSNRAGCDVARCVALCKKAHGPEAQGGCAKISPICHCAFPCFAGSKKLLIKHDQAIIN